MSLLTELNLRDGLTCVIVTHDEGIGDQCDRVIRMRDGRVVEQTSSRVVAGTPGGRRFDARLAAGRDRFTVIS